MKQRRCFLQNRIIWDNFSKDTDLYILERAGAQDVWGCSGVIGGLCLFSIAMEGNKKIKNMPPVCVFWTVALTFPLLTL